MTRRLLDHPFRSAASALLAVLGVVGLWACSPKAVSDQPSNGVVAVKPLDLAVVAPRLACADLAKVDMTAIGGTGSTIASAAEGSGAQPGPVCIVEGTLAPAIRFRVELPAKSWTQRYLQTGCGGLCGNLNINIGAADGCPNIDQTGFVVASTDMGHEGMGGEFGRDPQRRADFAYRGVHLTAIAAKALIRAYYGKSEKFSYFSGCSDGGREALIEAERFPADFNGIIAGAPAMNFQVQNSLYHGWQARSNTGPDGKAILVADRLPILHAAVLKACDALDGQADGLISAPSLCHFDPMTIVCKPGHAEATCLTQAEATVADRFYKGPRDAKTGVLLTQGGPQYGSELAWGGVYVPQAADQPIFSTIIANGSMGNLIFPGGVPATVDRLSFDQAIFDRLRARHPLFDATNPDLSAFVKHGGKLILFHGWGDPHISPINTIAYYDAVEQRMGASAAAGFVRLYLMPGMYHCSGGEGPSKFDLLTPVMAWVERDDAPDAIMTWTPDNSAPSDFGLPKRPLPGGKLPMDAKPLGPRPGMQPAMADVVARSRPVYPYPYIAAYAGHGDANDGANYVRGKAIKVAVPQWAGSGFYQPYDGVTG
jgi:feruloyl esterase